MQITLNNEGSGELYLQIMKSICGDTSDKTLLDIMCHTAPYTPQLGFKERTYIDIQNRPLDFKEEQKNFIKSDVLRWLKKGKQYDCMICSDGIEHLSVRDGRLVVSLMERYSEKQIIFTPLGYCKMERDNPHDIHRSGWHPDYFEGWAKIILPQFHPSLNIGAFFVFHCEGIKEDFKRIKQELSWIKEN